MSDLLWYINIAAWGLCAPILVRGARAWAEDRKPKEPEPSLVVALVVADGIEYKLFSAISKMNYRAFVIRESEYEKAQGIEFESIIFLGPVRKESREWYRTRVKAPTHGGIRK